MTVLVAGLVGAALGLLIGWLVRLRERHGYLVGWRYCGARTPETSYLGEPIGVCNRARRHTGAHREVHNGAVRCEWRGHPAGTGRP